MIIKTPTKYFFVAGASEGYSPLNAFDGALLDAGIGNVNLVKMSSIVPPRCTKISPCTIPAGSLVPVAYASISSDIKDEYISAAVAAAFPVDPDYPGLIMEYSAQGRKQDIENIVRHMAEQGMMMRQKEIREIQSIAIEYQVKKIGAAFAAVVLWD
ncbi:MAG: arginine decarboxylase, pyruvoyl-dependent [bacterium]|nr:arginine decarboxylase, pyruvoyl-dependent [bacterium]